MIQKDFYKEASIAFTGHREIPSEQQNEVRERLKQAVILAYKQGKYRCFCGMALGFDLMAAEVVLSLKGKLPSLQLIAVVPFKGQKTADGMYRNKTAMTLSSARRIRSSC